jgi:hypothetical protein
LALGSINTNSRRAQFRFAFARNVSRDEMDLLASTTLGATGRDLGADRDPSSPMIKREPRA